MGFPFGISLLLPLFAGRDGIPLWYFFVVVCVLGHGRYPCALSLVLPLFWETEKFVMFPLLTGFEGLIHLLVFHLQSGCCAKL